MWLDYSTSPLGDRTSGRERGGTEKSEKGQGTGPSTCHMARDAKKYE